MLTAERSVGRNIEQPLLDGVLSGSPGCHQLAVLENIPARAGFGALGNVLIHELMMSDLTLCNLEGPKDGVKL